MAFNGLPLEVNENIASCLDHDSDIQNFRLICQAANSAVTHHRCDLWRKLYARRYDVKPGMKVVDVRMAYMIRTKFLRRINPFFYIGQECREIVCLRKLRDLVVESFTGVPMGYESGYSRNIAEVHRFLLRSNLLNKVLSPVYRRCDVNPLMLTLQLVFTRWQLDLAIGYFTYGFGYSKHAVYGDPYKYPLFLDQDSMKINTIFCLHIVNFFKYHLTNEKENTLFEAYSQLEKSQRPQAWNGQLQQGRGIPGVKKLGKHWKGSYSYLDAQSMARIRSLLPEEGCDPIDNISADEGFQTLELDFSHPASTAPWPQAFESHLRALPKPALCTKLHHISKSRTRRVPASPPSDLEPDIDTGLETPPESPNTTAPTGEDFWVPGATTDFPPTPTSPSPVFYPKRGLNYLRFSGLGVDAEPFLCSGVVHPIPPQEGIPGWQRVSMMKYFGGDKPRKRGSQFYHKTSNLSAGLRGDDIDFVDDDDVDINGSCWCYEGVVLPGGMIMVGRWWSPVDGLEGRECVGPFIFWNVDGP